MHVCFVFDYHFHKNYNQILHKTDLSILALFRWLTARWFQKWPVKKSMKEGRGGPEILHVILGPFFEKHIQKLANSDNDKGFGR